MLDWWILRNRPDRLQAEEAGKGQEEEEFEDDEVKDEVVGPVPPNSVRNRHKQFPSHTAPNRRRRRRRKMLNTPITLEIHLLSLKAKGKSPFQPFATLRLG